MDRFLWEERHLPRFLNRTAILAATVCLTCFFSGCVAELKKTEKIKDIEFTVLDEEDIPEEVEKMIEEKKEEPFRIVYADQGKLYIAEGYGAQPTTGYSVSVSSFCETERALYIRTDLMGPEKGEETKQADTFPYVAVQTEYIDKKVIFE